MVRSQMPHAAVRTGMAITRLSEAPDSELLRRAIAEPEAFGVFYERHVGRLLAFVGRRTASADVALDVCAEVFACALEAAPSFVASCSAPEAWLYTIARNKLADLYRAKRTEDAARRRLGMQPIEITDEGLGRIEAIIAAHDAVAVQALDELSDVERSALQARVLDERDYGDIAHSFSVSESVIRKRVSRGLAHIRTRVSEAP